MFSISSTRHGRHGEADVDVPAGGDPHSCQHLPLVHGEGRGPPHPEAAGAAADRRERDLLHQDPEVLRDPEIESSGTTICAAISTAAALFPCMPTRRRSSSHRERTSLRRCWRSCKRRRSSFFWSTSSLMRGICGAAPEIWTDKAAQGVDVRVLYDGMLEISTLPWDYPRRLEKLGIRCKAFAPIQPSSPPTITTGITGNPGHRRQGGLHRRRKSGG